MLGAWRVAGIWSLGALQLVSAKKTSPCPHAILPAQACKLHWVTTNSRYLIPQTKSTNKTIFCTYLHSLLPKNIQKRWRFWWIYHFGFPSEKKKNHHEAQGPGSGSNGAPDVVPLGTWTFVHLHHHHQSRRSVTSKGHGPSLTRWRWEILGFERLSQLRFFRIKPIRKPVLGLKVDINPSRKVKNEEDFGEKNQHLENWISFETLSNWCVCHISTIASYKDDHRKKKRWHFSKSLLGSVQYLHFQILPK